MNQTDTEWLTYHATDKTVAIWDARDPTRRRVFSARLPDGKPNPIYAVTRWLVQRGAKQFLGLFLSPHLRQEALVRECEEYCATFGIREWWQVTERVYELLACLTRYEATRQITMRLHNPRAGMSDIRLASGIPQRRLREE